MRPFWSHSPRPLAFSRAGRFVLVAALVGGEDQAAAKNRNQDRGEGKPKDTPDFMCACRHPVRPDRCLDSLNSRFCVSSAASQTRRL